MIPYTCPELDRVSDDAASALRVKESAASLVAKAASAKAAAVSAEVALTSSPSDENAKTFIRERERASDAEAVAEAIAKVGGPEGLRRRRLQTAEIYAILADGFARRAEALAALLVPAREAQAAKISELALKGQPYAIVTGNAEVRPLSARVLAIESALQRANEDANYCRHAAPRFARTFDELRGALSAPLPA